MFGAVKAVLNLKCTFGFKKIGWLYFLISLTKGILLLYIVNCASTVLTRQAQKRKLNISRASATFLRYFFFFFSLMHLQATQNNKKGKWCELIETLDFLVVE